MTYREGSNLESRLVKLVNILQHTAVSTFMTAVFAFLTTGYQRAIG